MRQDDVYRGRRLYRVGYITGTLYRYETYDLIVADNGWDMARVDRSTVEKCAASTRDAFTEDYENG